MKNRDKFSLALTKREHFAGLAMQGWLSTHFASDNAGFGIADKDKIAKWSIEMADELLKQLDVEQTA